MANSTVSSPSRLPTRKREPSFQQRLKAARVALQKCQPEEALKHCDRALQDTRLQATEQATVQLVRAEALENLARLTEAVQVLAVYEHADVREALPPELRWEACLRLGSAYGGTKDVPKALNYAKQALTLATQFDDGVATGKAHLLLGNLYRRVGETWFARDHFLHARAQAMRQNDKVLLAQVHNGLGVVAITEGNWAQACTAFDTAREAIGKADEPLLRGSLDINLAAVVALEGNWRASVTLLESALTHLQRAHQPRLIANARTNLGYSLLRLGEMQRAKSVLKTGLAEARACEVLLVEASTLETLGELSFLQGDFTTAVSLLRQALEMMRATRVSFNLAQAQITWGRCLLLIGKSAQAAEAFQTSLETSEHIGDARGQAAARLWLAEARLASAESAQQLLNTARAEVEQLANVPLLGHLRELSARLALLNGQQAEAIRQFKQAASIHEMTGDRYRAAVASYHLGQAYLQFGDTARAVDALEHTRTACREMAATPLLELTEAALQQLTAVSVPAPAHEQQQAEQIVAALTRLLEANLSRELLLHEFSYILHREFDVAPVIILQQAAGAEWTPLVYQGCTEHEARESARQLQRRGRTEDKVEILMLRSGERLALQFGARGGEFSESLLRLFINHLEIGLERCRWRHELADAPALDPASLASHQLSLPGLIYNSTAMRCLAEQVHSIRSSSIVVLITGESGTGKELVARAIHALSARAGRTFATFNCAATPRELIESQLFGHRRGAFTGAVTESLGIIGEADNGTLFLDEIGEMPRDIQPKLLRFLQDGEVQRVGHTSAHNVDVRVIAATNADLERMIARGEFRPDLYYRLNVIQFHLPPLRERREEIPLLAEFFLARYLAQANKDSLTLAPSAFDLLQHYHWPGNVRQLENEIQRLVALAPAGARITPELLSPVITRGLDLQPGTLQDITPKPEKLPKALDEMQKRMVKEALTRHQGNLSKTADELGISRFGLSKMLTRLQLSRRGT
jgi:DNA-binding NtrC family response regulator/tetratricopeptide (TPR) repeat protein